MKLTYRAFTLWLREWARAKAQNISFETLNGGQFMLSTLLIMPNYLVILSHWHHHSFFRNLPFLLNEFDNSSKESTRFLNVSLLGESKFLIVTDLLSQKNSVSETIRKKKKNPTLLTGSMLNPLQPNISMHILHTVLYPFPKLPPRRISLTI